MTVTTEKRGSVTTIVLHRPEVKNAVDGPTAQALADAFRDFENDAGAAVAVLHGAGNTFCAGADLKAFATERINRLEPTGDGPMGPTRMRLSKPVIAAVEGYAVAGGLELALWCDLRVAADDSIFGVFCRRWGVPLIDGGTFRLAHAIGQSRALDLILTGREVTAKEALEIGLVNRVVPHGQTRLAAEELAAQISAFPQACLRADRASVFNAFSMPESELLTSEFLNGFKAVGAESLEGAQRFTERKSKS